MSAPARAPKPFAAPGGAIAPLSAQRPPAPFPEPPVRRVGSWDILRLDSTLKRALVRCSNCSTVRQMAADALEFGFACECARKRPADRPTDTFAADVAAVERRASASRHRGK